MEYFYSKCYKEWFSVENIPYVTFNYKKNCYRALKKNEMEFNFTTKHTYNSEISKAITDSKILELLNNKKYREKYFLKITPSIAKVFIQSEDLYVPKEYIKLKLYHPETKELKFVSYFYETKYGRSITNVKIEDIKNKKILKDINDDITFLPIFFDGLAEGTKNYYYNYLSDEAKLYCQIENLI